MMAGGASVLVLLVIAVGSRVGADDFAFDVSDDLEIEFDSKEIGDDEELTAGVGRVFHLSVGERRAFAGRNVKEYETKKHVSNDVHTLPSWLLFDRKSGTFWGVPLAHDVGTVRLTISAENISDHLEITVKSNQISQECSKNEDVTILTLLLDKNVRAIKPKQRIVAVNNIAKFFGLPYSAFTLKPQVQKDDLTDSSVVLAGPGNLISRSSKSTSSIQVPIGCDGKLSSTTKSIVRQLKQQARDGTISEVLRLPLIGWRVRTETGSARTKRDVNEDDFGSGDYDDYYDGYDEYEEEDVDEDNLGNVDKGPKVDVEVSTVGSSETTTHPHRHHHGEPNPSVAILRDHHHHPEDTTPFSSSTTPPSTTAKTTTFKTTSSSPPTTPGGIDDDYDAYDYSDNYDDEDGASSESETIVPDLGDKNKEPTPMVVFEDTESLTTEVNVVKVTVKQDGATTPSTTSTSVSSTAGGGGTTPGAGTTSSSVSSEGTTFQIVVDSGPEELTTEIIKPLPTTSTEAATTPQTTPTTSVPSSTTTTTTTTTTSTTTPPPSTSSIATTEFIPTEDIYDDDDEITTTVKEVPIPSASTTPKAPTTVREVTESIEVHENFNPFIENRLKQQSVIAGKIFRFVIPENTFKDMEDEYDLTYLLLDEYNRTITNRTWLNFNPMRREIYGLPLERHVSKWVFWVKAFDRDGGSAQEKLLIQVQQHKLDLVVNHEFSLYIRIEKHQEFPHYVDWCLRVLRALERIYNANMSEITVRNVNNTNEPVIFTWSNDSLPINLCPKSEIEELYRKLTANDAGDPSRELNTALSPEMRVKKVLYKEMGVCEPQPQAPVTPPTNFSPILRNPVDHINATVGELLIFKVKDDTFYDPEDVDPRVLNITLLTADRQPIPVDNWLQFDSKNREFYGIPRKSGRSEYQLVCVDTGGLPARDSLEVVVYPPTKKLYNVEFSMNITDVPHDVFVRSAPLQRKFVEKLMNLFGDSTPHNIYLPPFRKSYESTIVTWYNKSLPVSYCSHEDIDRLESILHGKDNSISHRVYNEMEPEFRVSTIKVLLVHNCKPREKRPEVPGVPVEETQGPQSGGDEYLITFIVPAVIIAVMLLLAATAAIVLYRRRRMGKMNIEEDGRSGYGNKGIPVIFQEELEEKPESGTKAPVILKDEKPPLAPPEYSKSGSVRLTDDSEPYQPPPPFARPSQENGRQGRPKPTPTYRKPPPYVPP